MNTSTEGLGIDNPYGNIVAQDITIRYGFMYLILNAGKQIVVAFSACP